MSNPIDDSYTEHLGPVLPSIADARRRREEHELDTQGGTP